MLEVTGNAEQTASINVTSAELLVAGGASYALDANNSILGNGTLAVAGTLTAAGDGVETISTNVVDSGVIAANLGTLELSGAVTGSGAFSIGTLGLLQFGPSATVAASDSVSFTGGTGALVLDDPTTFSATIADFAKGDTIGLYGFGDTLTFSPVQGFNTQINVSDGQGDSVILTFATAQNVNNFSYGAGPQGLTSVMHT